jgi:hypothetical protein
MRRQTPLREDSPDETFEEIDWDLENDLGDDEEWLEGGMPSRTEREKVLVG